MLRNRVAITFDQTNPRSRSRTKQNFAKDANINNIMSKAEKTGYLVDPLSISQNKPQFSDYSNIPDFQQTANIIIQAQEAFMALPSAIRAKFNHNPGLAIDYIADPANKEECQKLGLLPPPTPEEIASINAQRAAAQAAAGQAAGAPGS